MEIKVCVICNEEKPITEYHKNNSYKDGRFSICKSCRKVKAQKYYEEHKATIKERAHNYYHNIKKKGD